MDIRNFTWSKEEKRIARAAYNKAYQNEVTTIYYELKRKMACINDHHEIWKLHDYLSEKRKEVDDKYDYRYSVLIFVFARLLREGYLTEEDLAGISEEKLVPIRRISGD